MGPFEHDDGYKTSCYHFEVRSVSCNSVPPHPVYLADRIPADAFRRCCPAVWRSQQSRFQTCVVVVNASRRPPRIIGGTEPERGEGRGEVDRLVTYLYRGGFVLCPLSLLAKVAALGNLQTDKHTNFEHYTIEGSRGGQGTFFA